MDGPHVAKVALKSTKNCLISVPSQWISIHTANTLMVFEVQYNGDQKAYFSWSGECTLDHAQNVGRWTVDINGFYALKLGLCEGEEVLVTRKSDIGINLECVRAEPVAVDDWEILEIHSTYVQNNLMNQVRVVWNDQLLPIWVNQSVCILVKISGLEPDCPAGILQQMTDVIVTPRSRPHRSVEVQQHTTNVESIPEITSVGKNETSGIAKMAVEDEKEGKPWKISGIFGNVFSGWFEGKSDGHLGSPTATTREENSTELCNHSEFVSGAVVLRVHPLDPADILENFSSCSQDGPAETMLGSMDIRMLLSQPTTVVTLSRSLTFVLEQPGRRRRPIVIGEITKMLFRDQKSAEKSDKKQGSKDNSETGRAQKLSPKHDQKTTKETPNSGLRNRRHFVKVVLLDILWDYIKDSSADDVRIISALGKHLMPGVVLLQEVMRRQTGCDVTSRLRLRFKVEDAFRPTTVTFYPLQSTAEKNAELSIQKSIRLWLLGTSALNCPLVATNGALIEVANEQGPKMNFILQSQESLNKGIGKGPLLVTSSVQVDLQMDTRLPDETILMGGFDAPLIGMKSAALGGIAKNVHRGLLYLKSILRLGPISQELRHPACATPSGGGLIICGAQGTGRTTLARALCRDLFETPYFVFTKLISCKPLKGKRVETIVEAWRKAYQEARYRSPSIIILDDLDALVGAPNGPENEIGGAAMYQTRLAEALYEMMKSALVCETAKVATIGTCKSIAALHKTLASPRGVHLFQQTLTISAPNAEQREDILKRLILSKPLISSQSLATITWRPLADKTEGFVAHDLEMIVDRAAHVSVATNKGVTKGTDLLLTIEDFERALKDFEPMSLRGLNLHPSGGKGWDDVGGLDDVKQALVETLQWPTKYPALFSKCPLPMRSGILLYGPPGTGKTLLAGVVAKECGMQFISIKGPELLSKYIGASEQAVRDLFDKASNARPCIIFFDEFDSLAPRRGHDSTGVTDRVVNQLLTQMDGVEGSEGVYVLAATSRPDLIDPALLRPGRLDKSLYCPLPLSEEREAILRALSRSMALCSDVSWSTIAEECRHFSGADLQGLLYNAQLKAIHRASEAQDLYKVDPPSSPSSTSSTEGTDQGSDDFVNVKFIGHSETTSQNVHFVKSPEGTEWTMVHIPRLEDGPVAIDEATCSTVKQQLDAISSSLYGWPMETTLTRNGHSEESKSPVIVTHQDLMEAIGDTKPSVSPSDRQHYRDIYHKFVKSKKGQFQLEGSAATRTTLA